ncbi:hypothetical protein NQL31_000814 [Lotmaria passim]
MCSHIFRFFSYTPSLLPLTKRSTMRKEAPLGRSTQVDLCFTRGLPWKLMWKAVFTQRRCSSSSVTPSGGRLKL